MKKLEKILFTFVFSFLFKIFYKKTFASENIMLNLKIQLGNIRVKLKEFNF